MEAVCTNLFGLFCFCFLSGHTDTTKKICDYVIPPACTVFTFFLAGGGGGGLCLQKQEEEKESLSCVCVWFCCRFLHLSTREKSQTKEGPPQSNPLSFSIPFALVFLCCNDPVRHLYLFFFSPTFISWETARFSPPLLVLFFFLALVRLLE
jgi:hypothetical protein